MPSLPRSRVPRSLLFGTIALAVLLLVLATLQYRWLGQISEADEARLRAGPARVPSSSRGTSTGR